MKPGIGFLGICGVAFASTGGVLALTGGGLALSGSRDQAAIFLMCSAFVGSPGIFFWSVGRARKRRMAAVCMTQQAVGQGVDSVIALANVVGFSVPETAWCVDRAISEGMLPGKTVDLAAGAVVEVRPPALPVPAPAVFAQVRAQQAPAARAAASGTGLEFLDDDHCDSADDFENGAAVEDSEEAAEDCEEAAPTVSVEERLSEYSEFVHRRTCVHCGYYGRMGINKTISRAGTRFSGKAVNQIMGQSGLSRWMTKDLRQQKDQWEAICPSCEGKNYFEAYR
ncbi:hypothetical protein [Paludibaculum fermentans]|uniref:hypothetical protein n=1 Tax=Paludibaculum fermentans TaxID=1473598 RepID=UPI003EBB1DDF